MLYSCRTQGYTLWPDVIDNQSHIVSSGAPDAFPHTYCMQILRKVPLYEFCTSTRVWQAILPNENSSPQHTQASDVDDPKKRFTCVTYNVFSGHLSKSVPHAIHRTKSAISLLSRSNAHVIALQEVSPGFEQSLRRERWLRQDWLVTSLQDYFESAHSTSTGSESEKDGCVIAIRKNMVDSRSCAAMLPLSGRQGKVLITVKAQGGVGILGKYACGFF